MLVFWIYVIKHKYLNDHRYTAQIAIFSASFVFMIYFGAKTTAADNTDPAVYYQRLHRDNE